MQCCSARKGAHAVQREEEYVTKEQERQSKIRELEQLYKTVGCTTLVKADASQREEEFKQHELDHFLQITKLKQQNEDVSTCCCGRSESH